MSRMSNTEEVERRSKSKTEIFNNLSKEDVEKYQEAFSVSSRLLEIFSLHSEPAVSPRRSGIKIPVVGSVWQSLAIC